MKTSMISLVLFLSMTAPATSAFADQGPLEVLKEWAGGHPAEIGTEYCQQTLQNHLPYSPQELLNGLRSSVQLVDPSHFEVKVLAQRTSFLGDEIHFVFSMTGREDDRTKFQNEVIGSICAHNLIDAEGRPYRN